jgi:glycosyltransferase involved in cell wall biosynthesis
MPVYNEPERVGRAIDSVLAQTFDRFELIVVDDGSSDGTSEILSSYADDRRVRLLVNDGNIGLVRSLNRGLAVCRAPLVARLDADDHMEPTRLERQTALFDDDPRLTLSATAYRRVDSAGEFIRLGSPPLDHGGLAVAMLTGNRIQHSSIMFDRAAALGHGGYREAWFPVEDYDLWLRMLRDGKYRGLPSVEVSYTENPDGISSRRAAEQRSKSLARSARYIADLTGRPATQLTADGMTMSDIVRSARSIRRRLRRRGIADGSLERETLTACNGALRDRSRLVRALLVAARSPRAALLGRIGDR